MEANMLKTSTGVTFDLGDGNTVTCPYSSIIIFIDDTGHEGLHDRTAPFFGYGGCLTSPVDYENAIMKPWKLVEKTFPIDMLPLHASNLKPTLLTNANFNALNDFFIKNTFGRFAAITTDKAICSISELETIRYMAIAIHQRILHILRAILNHGMGFDEIFMFIERSERTEHKVEEYFSEMELQFGTYKIPIYRHFMTKVPNESGLVVADFIAHTAGTTVRSKQQGKVPQYLTRLDFKSVFTPQDDRWTSFIEVNKISGNFRVTKKADDRQGKKA